MTNLQEKVEYIVWAGYDDGETNIVMDATRFLSGGAYERFEAENVVKEWINSRSWQADDAKVIHVDIELYSTDYKKLSEWKIDVDRKSVIRAQRVRELEICEVLQ